MLTDSNNSRAWRNHISISYIAEPEFAAAIVETFAEQSKPMYLAVAHRHEH